MLNKKLGCRLWMIVWAICAIYFIIAAAGRGCITIGLASIICGFMVARNMADVVQPNAELSGPRPLAAEGSRSNDGLDDAVRYWLCCGSKAYPHGAETCLEAKCGHHERVRFGTAKEHSEWQRNLSSNVAGKRLAEGESA